MLSSSVQASLSGRFAGSLYGESKLAGEELFFSYAKETGAPVYVYRFPNLFGKWCRPNYNSAVATWVYNIARDLPIMVRDPEATVTLVYIDDVVRSFVEKVVSCKLGVVSLRSVDRVPGFGFRVLDRIYRMDKIVGMF